MNRITPSLLVLFAAIVLGACTSSSNSSGQHAGEDFVIEQFQDEIQLAVEEAVEAKLKFGADLDVSGTVYARNIILKDQNGKRRITIESNGKGGFALIRIADADGMARAIISAGDDFGAFSVMDRAGNPRCHLAVAGDSSEVSVQDSQGRVLFRAPNP